jgi:ectoine hydroxylase-related dioxygenase (phytanoyl-CoA dioxygenase family)
MDQETTSFAAAIDQKGWATTRPLLPPQEIAKLRAAMALVAVDGRGGARNLLDHAEVRQLAAHPAVRALARSVIGPSAFAVRALLFDKTPGANWKVIWHQDLTIATTLRADVPGFGPWTEKAGVPHVQPPIAVLEAMVAIRLHLDPCASENGPVRVLDGTHRLGRLTAAAIEELRAKHPPRDCLVEEGGVLAFRPLLLHASGPSMTPSHRRVIHIEYTAQELPSPLAWHQRVA